MSDKKLNEVTANATVDYIIGTLNDGSTVRISKSDLADVLAEALGVAKPEKNGLYSKSYVPIRLTEDAWYEVQLDGSFYYQYQHPFSNLAVMAAIQSYNWSNSTGIGNIVLKGGDSVQNVKDYIRIPTSNSIRKIYVKGFSSSNLIATIIPIYAKGEVHVQKTTDDVDSISYTDIQ